MSHWYTQEGQACHKIEAVNGKLRDTNLRDARKHKFLYSVTTINQVPSKPQLIRWSENQILDAAIDYPPPRRIHGQFDYEGLDDDLKKWKVIVLSKSQKLTKDAAKRGQEIHQSLEGLLSGQLKIEDDENSNFTLPVLAFLQEKFGVLDWKTEQTFSHKLGFGGSVDLHFIYKKGKNVILDFKTKNKNDLSLVEQYDDHYQQTAAYRQGLDLPDAECYNLFISTSKPGVLKLMPEVWNEEEEEKTQRGWEMFKHLLEYRKLQDNYDPSW